MGKFETKQQQDIYKRDILRSNRELIAKQLFDVSKIFLTTVALGAMSPLLTDNYSNVNWTMCSLGLLASLFFAFIGYRVLQLK